MIPTAPHGVLCHYVHDERTRQPAQGSLSLDDFRRLLDAYGDRLIPASQWQARMMYAPLEDAECALTCDDGLREQLLVIPELESRGLTGFFNVYTGPLVGVANHLERDRWIRNYAFGGVEAFYDAWEKRRGIFDAEKAIGYRADYGYLTPRDREFRYWRDCWVTRGQYERVMDILESEAPMSVSHDAFLNDQWIRPDELRDLHHRGHVIGFHTHSHPTVMHGLSREQQALEYATSRFILAATLGVEPSAITTMSHPCGSVTEYGVAWMKNNGIHLAWGATMDGSFPYQVPRWSTGYFK